MDEILTRRKALVGTGGLIAAGGAGILLTGSAAAAESSLTIEGTSITTHDGKVDDVQITARIDGSYEGCEAVETMVFRLETIRGGDVEPIAERRIDVEDPDTPYEGDYSARINNVSLIENTSWEAWEFDATEDGSSKTTTVPIRAFFAASDGDNSAEATARADTNADVTVSNVEASADVNGEGWLDAEADSEVEE